jgi:hypothetical protein
MAFCLRLFTVLASTWLCAACTITKPGSASADAAPAATATATGTTPAQPTAPGSNVVGVGGIAAWDALANKDAVKAFPSLYLHQSVGQDLEDGAADIGFSFAYYGPDQAAGSIANGPHGGLFADVGPIDNGKPLSKINIVRREFKKQKSKLKVMTFSFGYADIMETVDDGRAVPLTEVMTAYKALVDEVKAAGVKFVHITPPLVFDPTTNPAKLQMRKYMLETFKGDRIFDLTDIESLDGGRRCEKGGVWHICQANRSTNACPSKGQGVDSDGQGHLCSKKAAVFSKALLYALHSAAL